MYVYLEVCRSIQGASVMGLDFIWHVVFWRAREIGAVRMRETEILLI